MTRIADVMSKIGAKRPLIVTDKFLRSSGTLDKVGALLAAKGIQYEVFDDTVPDPTVEVVGKGAEFFRWVVWVSLDAGVSSWDLTCRTRYS